MILSKQLPTFLILFLFGATACMDMFNTYDNTPKLVLFSANSPYPVVLGRDTLGVSQISNPPIITSTSSRGEVGLIYIEGLFRVISSCRSPNNSLKEQISFNKNTIKIKIKAKGVTNHRGLCPGIPGGTYVYKATVSKLDPGSYNLKIVHVNDMIADNNRRYGEKLGSRKYLVFEEEFVIK